MVQTSGVRSISIAMVFLSSPWAPRDAADLAVSLCLQEAQRVLSIHHAHEGRID